MKASKKSKSTITNVTVCPSQRITYAKKYVPERSKRYARFRNPVEDIVIDIVNRKRAFVRVSDTVIRVVK